MTPSSILGVLLDCHFAIKPFPPERAYQLEKIMLTSPEIFQIVCLVGVIVLVFVALLTID
jgi:hypothetical protein